MTTYGITPDGFNLKTFDVIREEINNEQRQNIDSSLSLSDDSSLGQANVSITNQLAELWETLQTVWSSNDPDTSNDWALVQVCALTGTQQNKWTKSTVTGSVTLNPNKALPAGSAANLTDQPNKRFLTLTEVPADPDGGAFDVVFEAENAGAIDVAVGQLSQINVAVDGWTAVTNAAAGTPGTEPEDDPALRIKRETELESAGSGNLNAIIAAVSSVSGVISVTGAENDKSFNVGELPPNSVHIIHRGGANQSVAEAIFDKKGGGTQAYGSVINTVTDSQNVDHYIGHTPAEERTVYVDITITEDSLWGTGSEAELQEAIADYINGLSIGESVVYEKVSATAFLVIGVYDVTDLKIGFSASPTGTVNLALTAAQYATCDTANVSVTAVP